MKIHRASEAEIDRRLALDRRIVAEAFCRGFDSESELPVGFMDLQDEIRDGLERKFFENFDDIINRSNPPPWKMSGSHSDFYFPAELILSERIIIELSSEILGDKLLGLVLDHLKRCESKYCVIAAVYGGKIVGRNHLGRFVINLEEIAVEESLTETWSRKVESLQIEN